MVETNLLLITQPYTGGGVFNWKFSGHPAAGMVGPDCKGFGQKSGGQRDWSESGTVAVGGGLILTDARFMDRQSPRGRARLAIVIAITDIV